MSDTQATLGLAKNDKQLAAIRQQARDIGATTAFSPTDVARTQSVLAKSGFNGDAILKSTESTVNLALASDLDIADAAVVPHPDEEAGEVPHAFVVLQEGASLTVDEVIERLADAVGFRYQWMPRQQQYAHPGVIMLLTPDGRVARYLYGIEFDPNDVRVGLLEASEGRSISTVERALLYCYRYDASEQKYVVMAWRVMQIGGGLTALLIGAMLVFFWRRELRKRRAPDTKTPRSLEVRS